MPRPTSVSQLYETKLFSKEIYDYFLKKYTSETLLGVNIVWWRTPYMQVNLFLLQHAI